jgi:hypothetical protein
VELALRKELVCQRMRRRMVLVVAFGIAGSLAAAPRMASAEGLFELFFGGSQRQQAAARSAPPQANFFADPFGLNQQQAPAPAPRVTGSGTAFCVRGCDGKYFQVTSRGNASLAQMCQAFCPASATKVFYGSTIDGASATDGERYAGTENAFAYRKALRADCTCNGRDPAGLAPVDLTLDGSLRPGDVVATTEGLVAYTGVKVGNSQTAEFTPIASYPGLTAAVRARLGEMKVAPVSAEMVADSPLREEIATTASIAPATVSSVPKSVAPKAKRAELQ